MRTPKKITNIPVNHFCVDYFFFTHKIDLLKFAEKQAQDPVMKTMWRLKKENLKAKRSEWIKEKSHQLRLTKGE